MSMYAPTIVGRVDSITLQEGLSGIPESVFAAVVGTAPEKATTLDSAIQLVYVRANWNKNIEVNGGKLPNKPVRYYSKTLVADVMNAYRQKAGTGVIKHITGETVSTSKATDAYTQVQASILPKYPSATIEVIRTIMRTWYYATVDGVVKADLILPAVNRYPTEGANAMMALDERHREVDEQKRALEEQTFFGRIGAAVTNLVSAPGELASAATTTAKVAGVGVVVGGLGLVAIIVWSITGKIRQLDANEAMREQHRTIRELGPGVAAAVIRKGR